MFRGDTLSILCQLPRKIPAKNNRSKGDYAVFTRAEFRRLNKFDRIYVLASGGMDSTFTALNMYNLRFWIHKPVILLNNDTGQEMKKAKEILERLSDHTEWPLRYLGSKRYLPESAMKIIIDSLRMLDEAKDLLSEGKYHKNFFPCCDWLKKNPLKYWIREENHHNDIFVLSIKPGDNNDRGLFLNGLRKKRTKFWYNRVKKAWFYYPLRDCKQKMVNNFFAQVAEFRDITHTGCRICPILALFDLDSETERYNNTMRVLENIYARETICSSN